MQVNKVLHTCTFLCAYAAIFGGSISYTHRQPNGVHCMQQSVNLALERGRAGLCFSRVETCCSAATLPPATRGAQKGADSRTPGHMECSRLSWCNSSARDAQISAPQDTTNFLNAP